MPTYIGENKIVDRYLGDKFLEAAYIGDQKVYDPYTEITGYLPMIFKSRATVALKNYRIYGTSAGAGVETENLVDVSFFTNNYSLDQNTGLPAPSQLNRICTISPINVNDLNTITLSWSTEVHDAKAICSIFNNGTLISRIANVYNNKTIDVSSADEMYICLYTLTISDVNYVMLVPGSTAPTSYIPPGYKIPILNTSGVTKNLFDKDATDTNNGYVNRCYIKSNGTLTNLGYSWIVSEYMPVEPNANYTIGIMPRGAASTYNAFYDVNKELISTFENINDEANTFTTPANAAYIRLSIRTLESETDIYMFVKGNTLPDHYIPHRYESNYDLFIGFTKLGEEEYVDYVEQKIYKMSEGTLVPTDPPVPLPPIPTFKGENTLSSTETLGEVTVKGRIRELTYRRIEYLKSTGTQYIITDIVPTNTTKNGFGC